MVHQKVLYSSEEREIKISVDSYHGTIEIIEILDSEEMVVTLTNSEIMTAALEVMQQKELPFADAADLLH